jgi:protein-S-isoprenylcysteine O-methyltransferase Ste14
MTADQGNGGTSGRNGEHPAGDAGQLALLGLFLVVWVLDSFFLRWTTLTAAWLPAVPRLVAAGLVMALAFLLAKAAHPVTEGEEGTATLISSGVFARVRHPLYLGSLLFYAALTLATCSLASLGALVVIFLFYDHIAGFEERVLLERFGDEYRDYMKKTGKWIPKPRKGPNRTV